MPSEPVIGQVTTQVPLTIRIEIEDNTESQGGTLARWVKEVFLSMPKQMNFACTSRTF
jgi:hypothetical protein